MTSHFGCGHIEIAFYEKAGRVGFYGVRNTARSNAHRPGGLETAKKLLLVRRDEARVLIREVAPLFEEHGLVTGVAAAHECAALSVDGRLLHPDPDPDSESRALDSLRRKYEKLQGFTRT